MTPEVRTPGPPVSSQALYHWATALPMSQCMRFPTMWYVRPAKSQISLRIRAFWSEPLLVAWICYDCWATDWTAFGVSKLKRRLHRLVWVYTCQNVKLLEIMCHGSYINISDWYRHGEVSRLPGWCWFHRESCHGAECLLSASKGSYSFYLFKSFWIHFNMCWLSLQLLSAIFVLCWYPLQTVWTQIRTDLLSVHMHHRFR